MTLHVGSYEIVGIFANGTQFADAYARNRQRGTDNEHAFLPADIGTCYQLTHS